MLTRLQTRTPLCGDSQEGLDALIPVTRPSRAGARAAVRQAGFSLVEVLVSLTILAVVGTIVVSLYFERNLKKRAEATMAKQKGIYRALMGDGSDWLGFVGDIGRLPSSLNELVANPNNLPAYAMNATTGVGTGWRGPYLLQGPTGADPLVDAWGGGLLYNASTGQVTSLGPDQVSGTADDLVYPVNPIPILGTLIVTPYANNIPNPSDDTLTVWETTNGVQAAIAGSPFSTSSRFITTQAGFSFGLTQGVHAVEVVFSPSSSGATLTQFERFIVIAGKQTRTAMRMTSTSLVKTL